MTSEARIAALSVAWPLVAARTEAVYRRALGLSE